MVFNAYVADHEEGHHDVIDGVDYSLDCCPLCEGGETFSYEELHPEVAR